MTGLGQQIELIQFPLAMRDAALFPLHALVEMRRASAEPVEDFERALRKADRARPVTDPVAVVEQHRLDAALTEIDRECEPDRPGPDNDDRVAHDSARRLIGRLPILELAVWLRGSARHLSTPDFSNR